MLQYHINMLSCVVVLLQNILMFNCSSSILYHAFACFCCSGSRRSLRILFMMLVLALLPKRTILLVLSTTRLAWVSAYKHRGQNHKRIVVWRDQWWHERRVRLVLPVVAMQERHCMWRCNILEFLYPGSVFVPCVCALTCSNMFNYAL